MTLKLYSTSVIGRAIRLPLRLIPKSHLMPILKGPLRGCKWIVGSSDHGCWLGTYEHEKQLQFASWMKPGSVVYDLGANVGFYTLLAARCVGKEGMVYAFEPNPTNLQYIERHLELNSISKLNNFQIVPCAVSSSLGRATFRCYASRAAGHLENAAAHMVGIGSPQWEEISVDVISIDNWREAEGARPPDFVKIDIEGSEYHALQGMEDTIAKFHPRFAIGTHGEETYRLCVDFLRKAGYTVRELNDTHIEDRNEIVATYEPGR